MVQFKPVFQVPDTLAMNCFFWDGPSVAEVGVSDTVTDGSKLTVAAPVAPSTTLVAITVTFRSVKILAGAV